MLNPKNKKKYSKPVEQVYWPFFKSNLE